MMDNTSLPGETILLETKKFKWLKDIATGENLNIETIDIGEYNTVSLKTRIPFYKYFINYLLTINYDKLSIEKREINKITQEVFESIENGESHPMLEELADFIEASFLANGFDLNNTASGVYHFIDSTMENRTPLDKDGIIKDLRADSISREKMIAYAFGLGMDNDELETFLMKVLEETGLNIWDKKEGLVYIAFKHFPEDAIEFYKRAISLYDIPIYRRNDSSVEKIPGMNTVVLQNSINEYLNSLENIEKLEDDLIIDIITYHKELVSENTNRTIKSEFIHTLNDLVASFNKDYQAFDEDIFIEQGSDSYYAILKLRVVYESDEDIILDQDNEFVFESSHSRDKLLAYPVEDHTLSKTSGESDELVSLKSYIYNSKEDFKVLFPTALEKEVKVTNTTPGLKRLELIDFYITNESTSDLLDYLYSKDALISANDASLDDKQLMVLADLLALTKIDAEIIYDVVENSNIDRITRSRLVTLLFLDYLRKNQHKWHDILRTPAKRKRDYLIYMDHALRNCRLYEYNISNPYEDVLLKLIVDEEPVDAFRDLWAKYLYNIN